MAIGSLSWFSLSHLSKTPSPSSSCHRWSSGRSRSRSPCRTSFTTRSGRRSAEIAEKYKNPRRRFLNCNVAVCVVVRGPELPRRSKLWKIARGGASTGKQLTLEPKTGSPTSLLKISRQKWENGNEHLCLWDTTKISMIWCKGDWYDVRTERDLVCALVGRFLTFEMKSDKISIWRVGTETERGGKVVFCLWPPEH